MAKNVFGNRAQQQSAQPRASMCSYDDQVHFIFGDDTRQHLPDLTVANKVSVWDTLDVFRNLTKPLLGFILGVLVDRAQTDMVYASHHEQSDLGKDMHRMQRTAKTPANGGCIRQCRFGGRGKISGEQNVLHRQRGNWPGFALVDCALAGFNDRHSTPPQLVLGLRGMSKGGMAGVTRICDLNHNLKCKAGYGSITSGSRLVREPIG